MFRKADSITIEDLKEHYLTKAEATVRTACEALSCSYRVFRLALSAHGLEPKDKTQKFGADFRSPLLSNREWLQEQLAAKTSAEIAAVVNRTIGQVRRWIKHHGLSMPPRVRAAQKKRKLLTKEQIEIAYSVNDSATLLSAAKELGVCAPVLSREMLRHGIPSKPKGHGAGRRTCFPKLHEIGWLREQLVTRTLFDIAAELGTNASNVRQQAIRQGILAPADGTARSMKDGIKKSAACRTGENGNNWQGGRHKRNQTGYIVIHSPDHPNRTANGYVFEHRLVMEKHLGRYLDPKEVVHHRNGIRDDNRIENLELVESTGKHVSQHFKKSHRVHELEAIIETQAARIAELESQLSGCTCRKLESSSD